MPQTQTPCSTTASGGTERYRCHRRGAVRSDVKEVPMSDDNETHSAVRDEPTIAQIIERTKPMGNLDDLVIDDLTEEDERVFFRTLEDA